MEFRMKKLSADGVELDARERFIVSTALLISPVADRQR
jgi:hypothetical protein